MDQCTVIGHAASICVLHTDTCSHRHAQSLPEITFPGFSGMMLTRTLQSWSVLTMYLASGETVRDVTMLLKWPSKNCAGAACSACAKASRFELMATVKTSPNLSAQMTSLLSGLNTAAVTFLGQRLHSTQHLCKVSCRPMLQTCRELLMQLTLSATAPRN